MCPSDPNVGINFLNNYCGSFGTTTTNSTIQMTIGSTGLFTWWQILRHPELHGRHVEHDRLLGVAGRRRHARAISTRARASRDPSRPRRRYSTRRRTGPRSRAGLGLCNAAYNSQSIANLSNVSGNYWMHGGAADTLFNTVVTPNSQVYPWSYCTDAPAPTTRSRSPGPRATIPAA